MYTKTALVYYPKFINVTDFNKNQKMKEKRGTRIRYI